MSQDVPHRNLERVREKKRERKKRERERERGREWHTIKKCV